MMDDSTPVEPGLGERVRSRKFLFSVGLVISNTILVSYGIIPGDVYQGVVSAVILGYMGGNVAEKFSTRR